MGAAHALDALVGYVERTFHKKVAACQINVHMDSTSSHVNHRDVYGPEQKERVANVSEMRRWIILGAP